MRTLSDKTYKTVLDAFDISLDFLAKILAEKLFQDTTMKPEKAYNKVLVAQSLARNSVWDDDKEIATESIEAYANQCGVPFSIKGFYVNLPMSIVMKLLRRIESYQQCPYKVFYDHIRKELPKDELVICKICGIDFETITGVAEKNLCLDV